MSSNKYGYVGFDIPKQNRVNTGVFSIDEINKLQQDGNWGTATDEMLELIKYEYVTDTTALIFNDIKQDTYQTHLLVWEDYRMASTGQTFGIYMQMYESGVLQTGSVYRYSDGKYDDTTTGINNKSESFTSFRISETNLYTSSDWGHGHCYLYNLGDSSKMSFGTWSNSTREQNGNYRWAFGVSGLTSASEVDGLYISSASNFAGQFKLYGIRGTNWR